MKTILIDVDYVTADLHTEWLRRYNRDYEDNLTGDKITEWAVHKFTKPTCEKRIYEYLSDADLYTKVVPAKDALSGVHFLKENDYQCVFVSSGIHLGKVKWLFDYEFIDDESQIIFAKDKSLIYGDFMIDDYDENIKSFYKLNRHGTGILYNAPHNQHAESWMLRAMSWTDCIRMIVQYETPEKTEMYLG